MDLFEEIQKEKKDFPKVHSVKDEVSKYEFNFYQGFAISIFVLCFFLGIIFGNLFSTCTTTSYFYSDACLVTEFNFSLMITIWFIGLLVCVFFFALGHIIELLREISKKLDKFK